MGLLRQYYDKFESQRVYRGGVAGGRMRRDAGMGRALDTLDSRWTWAQVFATLGLCLVHDLVLVITDSDEQPAPPVAIQRP